jgi:hypothetical protein
MSSRRSEHDSDGDSLSVSKVPENAGRDTEVTGSSAGLPVGGAIIATPREGSSEAIALGCLCDPVENNNGAGVVDKHGWTFRVQHGGCPLHGRLSYASAIPYSERILELHWWDSNRRGLPSA